MHRFCSSSTQASAGGCWLSLTALLVTGVSASPANAQFLYRRLTLSHLAQRAEIIVQGKVIEARYEGHPDYPNISTVLVTLEVERMLRGPAERQFSFRQYLPGLQARIGKPEYLVGQRLLLFLPRPSQYGLSSPIGREQGRFQILRDRQGNELVENGYRNAGLFRDVAKTAAKAGASLTPAQARIASRQRGPVPLEDFVGLIQALSRAQ